VDDFINSADKVRASRRWIERRDQQPVVAARR
jgi:hypothetical protein